MALYLGGSKVKTNLNGVRYYLNLYSPTPITNGVVLLSSDDNIIENLNRIYLTAKKEDE